MYPALCSFAFASRVSLSPPLFYLSSGKANPCPHTHQPVSVNQLNHLRPENNPMTDSPSGLPLSAQPAWKADSQGTGCTGCCRQEFMLARAWWRWAFSKRV
ncbi:hypothetical protein D4764_01G0009390, partial [Takifugu flavidus]